MKSFKQYEFEISELEKVIDTHNETIKAQKKEIERTNIKLERIRDELNEAVDILKTAGFLNGANSKQRAICKIQEIISKI